MKKEKRSAACCSFFVIAVLAAISFVVFVSLRPRITGPVRGAPGAITKKYADALEIAMQFFDVQKSGKLEENKIEWRGDSGLKDGEEAKLDLSKGMYDAGDHIKFGFPMAFTATVLSWAILEYGDQMKAVDQLEPAESSLKWITHFLINAHPTDNVLYVQVQGFNESTRWGPGSRPWMLEQAGGHEGGSASGNGERHIPGSDVAAETAAALASASLVFKSSDAAYSTLLLKHATQLFAFADKYREYYSFSIPQASKYYNSTGYGDELLWAAGWLYHATMDQSYIDYVTGENGEALVNRATLEFFSWDNKFAGTQVLLSRVSLFGSENMSNVDMLNKYRESAEATMCSLLPGSPTATSSKTESGLIWVNEWDALQHPVALAFLALLYSDYMLTSQTPSISCDGTSFKPENLRDFAISQISYLVGYGDKYPEYVHHRGASIPSDESPGCKQGFKWLDSIEPNPNVAVGALVGGPFRNESYVDARNNSMQGEPTTYNTALIVGLLSGLITTSSVVTSFI